MKHKSGSIHLNHHNGYTSLKLEVFRWGAYESAVQFVARFESFTIVRSTFIFDG